MDAAKLRDAIKRMRAIMVTCPAEQALVCDAAEAHLSTLPKTKEVDVWHVNYAVRRDSGGVSLGCIVTETPAQAEDSAANLQRGGVSECIRVTGPHRQTVPA